MKTTMKDTAVRIRTAPLNKFSPSLAIIKTLQVLNKS
jgi:hypothetical protein